MSTVKRSRLSLNANRNRALNVDEDCEEKQKIAICDDLVKTGFCFDSKSAESCKLEKFATEADHNETRVPIASLKNLGNTCYLNSVVYCLLYVKEFRKIVHDVYVQLQLDISEARRSPCCNPAEEVVIHLHNTMKQMIQTKNESESYCSSNVPTQFVFNCTVLSPTKLLKSLCRRNSIFEGNSENDAHDALSCIMRCLEVVDEQVRDGTRHRNLKMQKNKKRASFQLEHQFSNIFQGKLLMKTKCLECESWSTTTETFTEISIPSVSNVLDFESSLKMEEILKGDEKYYCHICEHSNEAVRSCEYLHFPPVLTVNLKPCYTFHEGFDGIHKSLTDSIVVPEELSCLNDVCQPKPCQLHKFVLVAVICHIGSSLMTGHFASYIKGSVMYDKVDNDQHLSSKRTVTRNHKRRIEKIETMNLDCCDPPEGPTLSKEWVFFDDEHVNIVPVLPSFGGAVSTKIPYLLFYRKIVDDQKPSH